MVDPLLTEDLGELLQVFPNDALRALAKILKDGWSPIQFLAPRAYAAHGLADDADFKPHFSEIADEILWWGSNELVRQSTGTLTNWRDVISKVAATVGVPAAERGAGSAVWKIEGAVLRKVLKNWEELSPEDRQERIDKAGSDFDAARGGLLAALGVAYLGGDALLSIAGARVAGAVAAGTIIAPVAVALGAGWTAWDLAGPSLRIIRPAALVVAFTRQCLRDERIANAFKD